jgi:signal transduction histidine kinase
MNPHAIVQLRNPRLLNLSIYLALIVMIVIGAFGPLTLAGRVLVVLLCLLFGVAHTFGYYAIDSPRRAVAYFATQTLLVTGMLIAGRPSDAFSFLLFFLSLQAVLTLPLRFAVAWIVLFYTIDGAASIWRFGTSGIVNIMFNTAVYFFSGVFGYALRQAEVARAENQQLVDDLRLAQRQVQDLAIAEERNRLARELHDSVKQQVFATIMQLGAARALVERDPPAARVHLDEAEQLAQQAGAELSLLIHELRPLALAEKGLVQVLRGYAADWSRQSGIAAQLEVSGERPLPPAAEHALLRVAQEALANVARHSQASKVTIGLDYRGQATRLTIADDGRGFDPAAARGVGLDSMRERIEALGGRLVVTSAPGSGTIVFADCDSPSDVLDGRLHHQDTKATKA